MFRNRGTAIGKFLGQLADGDPFAWGFVGVLAVIAAGLGLLVLKARRDMKREDEAAAKRRRGGR